MNSKYLFAKKWAAELESDGHAQISTFFLENYHRLKPYSLTHGEAMFVVHLMQHKWGEEAPYPSYKTIAKRMGVSDKTARRLAKSLEEKKYLFREFREANTNRFHLTKLMAALIGLKKTRKPASAKKSTAKGN
jgi:DNA-binding MarR family transcriptional regulator